MRKLSIALIATLSLVSCNKSPKVAGTLVTEGFVDASPLTKWIEGPPEVLVVRPMDRETMSLLQREASLFSMIVRDIPAPRAPNAPSPNSLADTLDAIKRSFPAKAQRTTSVVENQRSRLVDFDYPSIDLWNKYKRTLAQAQVSTAASIASQLQTYVDRDTEQLSQIHSSYTLNAQISTNDLKWIQSVVVPIIAHLKSLDASMSAAPAPQYDPKSQARVEWAKFEENDLPVLSRVIEDSTVARVSPDDTGKFTIEGDGDVLACVKMAGRVLYLPSSGLDCVRFLSVQRSRQAPTN